MQEEFTELVPQWAELNVKLDEEIRELKAENASLRDEPPLEEAETTPGTHLLPIWQSRISEQIADLEELHRSVGHKHEEASKFLQNMISAISSVESLELQEDVKILTKVLVVLTFVLLGLTLSLIFV
jgi:hypothetical protein